MNLYAYAYSLLGKHLTLDETVDKSVGCGEALSFVLDGFGYDIPKRGIPGTAGIYEWCKKNADEVETPEAGDIIVSVTGTGNGRCRGHCGVVGKFHIMSNNSRTGLWDDTWTMSEWKKYYQKYGALKTKYYRI